MPGSATTVSFALDERADCVMGGAYGDRSAEAPYSFYPRRAWAAYLEDVDGRRHLDFHNNFAALIHGYGHPQVTRALMEEIAHGAPSFTGPSASEVGLAELLCGRVPALERVRFVGTPADALAMAVNAARALTGKAAIGRCEGACCGLWARMEAGSRPVAPRRRSDASGAEGGVRLRATPDNSVVLRFNDIAGTEAALLPRKSEIAAVIVDPLPWRLGMRPVARDYLAFLRDFTRRHGAF